ncbi:MAG TPA: hypothetical protein VFS20_13645 [Longimicrobium sp.]|nr:hypothetical protein [Longimicrobium sp.]
MRAALVLVPLLFFTRPLVAQPAADAPVPAHVTYLIEAARNAFAGVSGGATYGPGSSLITRVVASNHAMRFQGAEASSEIRVNANWNVMHSTWLPVAGNRAAADSAWDRLAREIASVIPAGWQQFRNFPAQRIIYWQECQQGRGREVGLSQSLSFQRPALQLIVYRYDRPCEGTAGGSGSPPGDGAGG